MSDALRDLIDLLSLEPAGDDRFRGRGSHGDGADGTFGGHFLGQATAAAQATVRPELQVHSIHAYFLRAGTPGQAIDYAVERVRDGRSFCTRRVRASQDDRAAFELIASFCLPAEGKRIDPDPPAGFAQLPEPTSLPRYHELMARTDPLPLPAPWSLREHGVDVRVVRAPWADLGPSEDQGICMWIRANGTAPSDPSLHLAMLAYQSDESISDNVLVPFGLTWGSPGVFFVSLDHALWVHRPMDFNRWHYVEQRPVVAANARGVSSGYVWSDVGELVASFTQEALMRFDEDHSV